MQHPVVGCRTQFWDAGPGYGVWHHQWKLWDQAGTGGQQQLRSRGALGRALGSVWGGMPGISPGVSPGFAAHLPAPGPAGWGHGKGRDRSVRWPQGQPRVSMAQERVLCCLRMSRRARKTFQPLLETFPCRRTRGAAFAPEGARPRRLRPAGGWNLGGSSLLPSPPGLQPLSLSLRGISRSVWRGADVAGVIHARLCQRFLIPGVTFPLGAGGGGTCVDRGRDR